MTIGPPEVGTPDVNSKWRIDIDLDAGFGGSWAQLKGISGLDPSVEQSIKDASDYDNASGWGADFVSSRKFRLSGTVMRKKYLGSYDAAQEKLRAIADSDDPNELVHVRFYERESGGKAYEGYALVQWQDQAGAYDDISTANFVLMGQGKRYVISNPFETASAPTVASLAPSGGSTAGGNLVTINGSGFDGITGASAVKFGATNATSYTVVSDNKIVAIAPAGTAGAKDVVVTNASGASANTPADDYTYA